MQKYDERSIGKTSLAAEELDRLDGGPAAEDMGHGGDRGLRGN
jgi:hypothetical protein